MNERIVALSVHADIRCEAVDMLDLDKHPDLQGGRFAARVWRSNAQCAHRVSSGENLFRLSMRYNTTVDTLKTHNYLRSDLLRVGQELALPNCARHMMDLTNTWICFKAAGKLVFIDTTSSPPAVYALKSFAHNGHTCAAMTGPGTVVLTGLQ